MVIHPSALILPLTHAEAEAMLEALTFCLECEPPDSELETHVEAVIARIRASLEVIKKEGE